MTSTTTVEILDDVASTRPHPVQSWEDGLPEYTPMNWSISEIKAAIPDRLFVRNTFRSMLALLRDVALAISVWRLAMFIDPFFDLLALRDVASPLEVNLARWITWAVYWWFQGLIFTGLWVIGHECGHNAFSDSKMLCNVVGYLHTLLFTPFFSWKISHHRHHMNHASMEKDEVYVPKTRSDLGIPREDDKSQAVDYEEYFGDTPLYTLFMLVRQQLLAFPAYLLFNVSGQKHYPAGTNHFSPQSILFKREQRRAVILSNAGIASMIFLIYLGCAKFGAAQVIKFYGIPWLCVTHWFIMITYLHHTAPELPHYRAAEWSFSRGAAATVDRPFLGWQGRFFLHDVAHFHVIHHFFPKMPWYHGAEATKYLADFLGEHYATCDTPVFKALWDNYNACQFVEDEGDILFYRNKQGRATRRPAKKETGCRLGSR